MWLVLFTMTFQRAITAANADERHRPAMWMWLAAPAIACLAYNSIVGEADGNGALIFDNISKSFMFMALSLFFCLGKCVAVLHASATCCVGCQALSTICSAVSYAKICASQAGCTEITCYQCSIHFIFCSSRGI